MSFVQCRLKQRTINMTENRIPKRRRGDRLLTLLAVLYFLGVVLGTILYCTLDSERAGIIDGIAESFVKGRLDHTFWETMVNSFSGAFLLLVLCFVLGFCVIAQPAEVFVPLFRGLGVGASAAGMYSIYGAAGAGASAVLIVPNAVISAFVLIMASREAVRFSSSLYGMTFGKNGKERPDVRLYFTKFVILCAVLAVSAFADSLLTFVFAGLWTGLLGL